MNFYHPKGKDGDDQGRIILAWVPTAADGPTRLTGLVATQVVPFSEDTPDACVTFL